MRIWLIGKAVASAEYTVNEAEMVAWLKVRDRAQSLARQFRCPPRGNEWRFRICHLCGRLHSRHQPRRVELPTQMFQR